PTGIDACLFIWTENYAVAGGNARWDAALGVGRSTVRPYVTRSNLRLGRYDRPTLPHGFPSSITTSAVKSKRPWNRLEPMPYASTGTCCSSNRRILSTVKPPDTTILTSPKPAPSSARRTLETSCGATPVGLHVPP